tara:strand:+ start:670 stop:849 length:180 start_codon:yes stop_codon:yes gene_type:complete
MFLKVQSQWHIGFNGVVGLHYACVLEVIRMYKVDDPIALFENIQIMEAAALQKMNKESK